VGGAQNVGSSFLQNEGKVAGVFLVVGIVTAAISLFIFLACRRRRKRAVRRRRWLAGIQRPLPVPDDPFEDPRDPPMAQTMHYDPADMPWDGQRRSLIHDENPSPMNPAHGTGAGGLGLSSNGHAPSGAYSSSYAYNPNEIGLAITTSPELGRSRRSLAQSSPSLYPPTLPNDDGDSVYEEVDLKPKSDVPPLAPPRPPRSHLRDGPKAYEAYPMTPPPSVSSHTSSSKPPSPIADLFRSTLATFPVESPLQEDVLHRRTLLDVRPRVSRENIGGRF